MGNPFSRSRPLALSVIVISWCGMVTACALSPQRFFVWGLLLAVASALMRIPLPQPRSRLFHSHDWLFVVYPAWRIVPSLARETWPAHTILWAQGIACVCVSLVVGFTLAYDRKRLAALQETDLRKLHALSMPPFDARCNPTTASRWSRSSAAGEYDLDRPSRTL